MFKQKIAVVILGLVFMLFVLPLSAASIKNRLGDKDSINYRVSFNGIYSGTINWQYLGQEMFEGASVEVLRVMSDTKIMSILDLESDDKVFLESQTALPLKVERNLLVFGKKEIVTELYNQKKGYVELINKTTEVKKSIIYQDKPIQNILALLYFFPDNIKLIPGKWMDFNLPTCKIKIQFVKERILDSEGEKIGTYFLIGRGAKRFSLWLDKKTRLPLRLEFISLAGKVTISRDEPLTDK